MKEIKNYASCYIFVGISPILLSLNGFVPICDDDAAGTNIVYFDKVKM